MRITMIGHSTVLLEGSGARIITDPYFGTFGHAAYARIARPARKREEIGRIDGVLVSHSHWDHTDPKFLKSLDPSIPVVVPAGTSLIMKIKGARNVIPLAPWATRKIGAAVVTAVPAVHIARTAGFIVNMDGRTVYFAGDTYHRPFMVEIARRFQALMPVSTYRTPTTMGERGAVAATQDLQPRIVIPIHLGLRPRFPLFRSGQSPEGFERRLRAAGVGDTRVVVLREGESHDE